MRIVFSTDQIYQHGGIEKVMAEKANYFVDTFGYEVIIVTTEQHGKKPCYPLSDKIQFVDLGINYDRTKSYFSPTNLFKIPNHFWQTKNVLKDIKPDVFIVVNYAFDFFWLPFLSHSIPKWKEFHSSRYYEALERQKTKSVLKKLKYRLEDFVESRYDKLIILNDDEVHFYKNKNCAVISNPVSNTNLRASLLSKKVVAAGRIAPVKGLENAILSWQIVAKAKPDWELHIYGDGDLAYQRKLQEMINAAGLKHSIFFKGAVANLQEVLVEYSIYLMSSHTECFPMVLLESLSVGLPVVSFDCPTGPRNILTDSQDGILVENQNTAALAEKLLYLIADQEKRLGMGIAAKKNSDRFNTTTIMEKWQAIISSV